METKETLEEAATNYTIDFATMSAFKLGAKWQQEQDKKMYSGEEVIDFTNYVLFGKITEFEKNPIETLKQFKNK